MPRFLIAPCVAVAVLLPAVTATASQRPVVRGFSISPAKFKAVKAGARGGTRLHFRLSKPATVRIDIARRGRRHYHHVGRLVLRHQRAGRHTRRFRGRLHGHKLAAGRYRARLVAVDGRHRHSKRRTEYFRIMGRSGSTPGPSPTPPQPAPTPPPNNGVPPGPNGVGVPAGWQPAVTVSRDMTARTAGAVIENYRFAAGATLHIEAPNVVVRNSEFQGGMIDSDQPGVLVENVTFDRLAPETTGAEGALSYCGYTAVRVAILDRSEGFRDGCDPPTHIQDSFARITPPDHCGDWHGDGIQGYTGGDLYVNNVTIDFRETSACPGNAPFFYPGGQGNSAAYVNGLLVRGGGYSFRIGTPGSVQGLRVVQGTWPLGWHYGPMTLDEGSCSQISPWEAKIVTVDDNWNITRTVRNLSCGG